MFSGKTTELLRRIRRLSCAGHSVIVIKHRNDTRYAEEDELCTHDRTKINAVATL